MKSKNDLTPERLRELLNYDPDTGVFIWRVSKRGKQAGTVAGKVAFGYRFIGIDGLRYQAHRLAWLYVHGRWPVAGIDHINRQRDDNRIENLREATHGQNAMNSPVRSDNLSGIRGVMFDKARCKYRARLAGRQLGRFETAEEAVAVYRRAAAEKYGEFVA